VRRSDLFATISKESVSDADCRSEELMQRAGLVKNFGSGTWSYTHLGKKVLDNIEDVVREEMDEVAQEVKMNQLQTSEMWKESGRWNTFGGKEFFSFENRDEKDFTVAATHEEAATVLAKEFIRSYRDLDTAIYQIARKFRDDHARKGLLRAKEFIMKDAYSFHKDKESMNKKYQEFLEAYKQVYSRLGLEFSVVDADNGDMGGSQSHEFIAEGSVGSDTYMKCENCLYGTKELDNQRCEDCGSELREVNGIEIGHCFKIGNRYTQEDNIGLTYTTKNGEEKEVQMASYGIGVSRLISAIIEQNNDEKGIGWNSTVSAFDTAVILASEDEKAVNKAENIYSKLDDAILFDGENSVGEKFAEADLIGAQRKVILGNNFLENGITEVETRGGETKLIENLSNYFNF